MEFAKSRKKISAKTCAYSFCTNVFKGSQFQRYCNDPRCNKMRKTSTPRKKKQDNEVDNRIIPKIVISRAISMKKKTISLKCKAINAIGKKCGCIFNVSLEARQSVYPKFCEEHRNAYKRKRYMLIREK